MTNKYLSVGTPEKARDDHVQFIPPSHDWKPLSSQPVNIKSPAIPKVLNRRRRKVISRAGHYILRSKTDGSLWGGSSQSSRFSSARRGDHRRPKSSGRNYNSRGNANRDGEKSGSSRYSSRNMRNYQRSRGNRRDHRKQISQLLKMEIGQFALSKGAKEASLKYSGRVGRKLKERIIEKFARRFEKRQQRKRERVKENRQRFTYVD